jgi:hypothetical protein
VGDNSWILWTISGVLVLLTLWQVARQWKVKSKEAGDRPDYRSDTFNSRRSGGRLAFHALEPPHEHFRHHGARDCDRLGGVAV